MGDELIRQIAANAGDHAVEIYGQTLPKGKQIEQWRRYRDSALAALMTLQELERPRRVWAFIGEN